MEAAPPLLANARHTKEKFCLHFRICARRIFSSKIKGKQNFSLVFCFERAGGGTQCGRGKAKLFLRGKKDLLCLGSFSKRPGGLVPPARGGGGGGPGGFW